MCRSSRREEKQPCCTFRKICFLLVVILILLSFLLVWIFVPWDDTINDALNKVPIPSGSEDSAVPNTVRPITVTTSPPSVSPEFQFMQCDPDNTGQMDCCNGLEGICDLRADEVMYATLHNAMSTFEDGFLFGPNHKSKLEGALEAGYRGLNLDICNCGGEVIFCHGICALGPRDVVDVMQNVNEFLDENPTEVVVFIYQVDNTVDQIVDLNQFYDKMLLVDGLVDKLYVHDSPDSNWPTLRQLTAPGFNKRILMFHYNGPDCTSDPGACPDGLHQYYSYAADNDWNHNNVASIEDRINSCLLKKNGINQKVFVGLNNFVSPPSQSSAKRLNAYTAANDYVDACTEILETDINFVIADFWGQGELPRVTQDHNAARALQVQRRERKLLRIEQNE